MQSDLTLNEAAERLGVSPRTIRRWIKEGKINATLQQSPYGMQYFISADQIDTAQEIHDVVRVDKQVDMADLARTMSIYLNDRESAIGEAIQTLRADLAQTARLQDEREKLLRQELEETRKQLAVALDTLDKLQDTVDNGYRQIDRLSTAVEQSKKEMREALETQRLDDEERGKREQERDEFVMRTLREWQQEKEQKKKRRWWQRG